jgi:hypothetical protein
MNPYLIIIVVVTVSGIGISIWGWRVLKTSQRAKQWPVADGVIEESETSSALNDLLPHILYRYEVAGENYRRTFEFPEGTHPMPEFNQAYLRKYPVGAAVKVHYDPQQPERSTLEPGTRGDWMILALGLLMAVGGVASLLAGL